MQYITLWVLVAPAPIQYSSWKAICPFMNQLFPRDSEVEKQPKGQLFSPAQQGKEKITLNITLQTSYHPAQL